MLKLILSVSGAAILVTLLGFAEPATGVVRPRATDEDVVFPMTPGPALCSVEPVPIESLPNNDSMRDLPTEESIDLTSSQAVPKHQQVEITAAIIEVFACLNSGEALRAYALYSDRYVAQVVPENIEKLATPVALDPADQTAIVEIRGFTRLPDGRIAVTVVLDPSLIPVEKLFLFVFVYEQGVWYVDDVLDELRFSLP